MGERATTPTVVIVEDHPMMQAAVRTTLARAGLTVLAVVASAQDAYAVVGELTPDAVVLDIGLPDGNGVDLARRLLARDGAAALVFHTGVEDPVALKDALACGAGGFAYKTGPPENLVTAVRTVLNGGAYVAPELRAAVVALQRSDRPRQMSERERQVLQLVAEGLSNEEIAERLIISVETVRTHVRNAMGKLGTHTRAHAVVEALRNEEIGL